MAAKILKWSLLILISITILTMLGLPGCYPHTLGRLEAYSDYRESPSEDTKTKLEQAKFAEWRHIAVVEVLLAVFLGLTFVAYSRIEKLAQEHEN